MVSDVRLGLALHICARQLAIAVRVLGLILIEKTVIRDDIDTAFLVSNLAMLVQRGH